ncbi:hypothetical protein C2E23DRAFT_403256 [Lenzites betulinus]|nr:hypothetical protein C2E23DRAFT_403256 [Lenzites betulinus]
MAMMLSRAGAKCASSCKAFGSCTRLGRATLSTSPSLRRNPTATGTSGTPVGVARALQLGQSETPSPTIFKSEFALTDRVALVTGGNRSLGLESALALIEAGARAVYCVDIAKTPGADWEKAREYVSRMKGKPGEGRLEYIHADVRDQEGIWKVGEMIGDREGRLDTCIACAGIVGDSPKGGILQMSDAQLQKVLDVNLKGVLFTAQAAGQQMERFASSGSIILLASVAGHICINVGGYEYEFSKAGVLQMGRSLACELASKGIRVNTISPSYIMTPMVVGLINAQHGMREALERTTPMGRIGEPHELRGAVVWLASDASSFCTGGDVLVSGGHTAW